LAFCLFMLPRSLISTLFPYTTLFRSANLFAGRLSDRIGRKGVLVVGWLIGLPVPLLIIFAPSWAWIVFANMLLGINQGLCWSTRSEERRVGKVGKPTGG